MRDVASGVSGSEDTRKRSRSVKVNGYERAIGSGN